MRRAGELDLARDAAIGQAIGADFEAGRSTRHEEARGLPAQIGGDDKQIGEQRAHHHGFFARESEAVPGASAFMPWP